MIQRIARKQWGFHNKSRKTIYQVIDEGTLLYGVEMWGTLVNKIRKNKLSSVQRRILIMVTRVDNTVSGDAVLVIAGEITMDIKVEERLAKWAYKNGHTTKLDGKKIPIGTYTLEEFKKQIHKLAERKWQKKLDVS